MLVHKQVSLSFGAINDCFEVVKVCDGTKNVSSTNICKALAMDLVYGDFTKELERENKLLKRMYAEEKMKAEVVAEALAKNW